jgi:hypothetical protein
LTEHNRKVIIEAIKLIVAGVKKLQRLVKED